MRFLTLTFVILSLTLISSLFASAVYYTETSSTQSTNVHNYDDSMYLHPDFAPKADIFYTPFNAYRTYYDAMLYPIETTQVVHVREAPVKLNQPKMIVVRHPYPYPTPRYQYPPFDVYKKPIAPIYKYPY